MEIKEKLLEFYYNNKKLLFKVLCLSCILLIFASISIIIFNSKEENSKIEEHEEVALVDNIEKEIVEETKPKKIMVDIKGYITNPGVYEMDEESRVNDVINASGGLLNGASVKYINLSKKVFDEMIIYIYNENELLELKSDNEEVEQVICLCEETNNDACYVENYNTSEFDINQNISENEKINENKLVNLNTSNIEELMTLPGIGELKAKSIINYREENGNFNSIEDLMEVSGIGESIYNKIKDYITTE